MANQEHLDIVKQGVEVWNQWREENPDVRPDLSDARTARCESPQGESRLGVPA